MMKLVSSLIFVAKYILIGLGAAALLVLLMPNRFGIGVSNQDANNLIQPVDSAQMIASASAAVVTIQVQSKAYPINSRQCFEGLRNYSQQQNACRFFNHGSGVIIDNEGHLVTSAHVVTFTMRGQIFDQAESVLIEFANGQKATAQIVGIDPESDIALLKMDNQQTSFLTLSNNNDSKVGEAVFAIGTPYMGFQQSVTSGIVSAKFFAKVSNYLQIDAQLRKGNSGGALLNKDGELIGITQLSTQDISGEAVLQNFAIAASDVALIVEQLKQDGKVHRGWLGLNGDMSINIDSIIQENQLSAQQATKLKSEIEQLPFGLGIVVTAINANGPADQAGLEFMDIVTQINGQSIYNTSDLLGAIWNKKPSDKVRVTYWRNGQEFETEVILGTKG